MCVCVSFFPSLAPGKFIHPSSHTRTYLHVCSMQKVHFARHGVDAAAAAAAAAAAVAEAAAVA